VAEGNGQDGFTVGNGVVYNCLAISNVDVGIEQTSSGSPIHILGCTVDGDSKDTTVGIELVSIPNFSTIANCLVYDCVTGIKSSNVTGTDGGRRFSFGNLVNANTADYDQWSTDDGEVTGAPVFVDEGTDYGLASGSPGATDGFGPDRAELGGGTGWITSANDGKAIGAMGGVEAAGITLPAVGDVQDGVFFGAGAALEGTLELPTEAQVEVGVGFGASGTEFTGEFVGGEILPFLEV